MPGTVLNSGGTPGNKRDIIFVLCGVGGLVCERDDEQVNREIKNCEKSH